MRSLVLVTLCASVGCITTPEQRQAEQERQADRDRELRREHMRSTGALNESEYEAVNRRTGVIDPNRRNLPRAPTTEELERKVEGVR